MATKNTGGQDRASRRSEDAPEVEVEVEPATDVQERVGKLTDDVDALLDDIDEALEANAEEFVKAYVQKGGQ